MNRASITQPNQRDLSKKANQVIKKVQITRVPQRKNDLVRKVKKKRGKNTSKDHGSASSRKLLANLQTVSGLPSLSLPAFYLCTRYQTSYCHCLSASFFSALLLFSGCLLWLLFRMTAIAKQTTN